ncbi:hypothetical protein [Nonomuraea bangladeshensis]|uniref:hypothetical protein n=1 Tax=Nonomuraea bangladeshensis TaxID=404385 RepID=UPI003C2AF83C
MTDAGITMGADDAQSIAENACRDPATYWLEQMRKQTYPYQRLFVSEMREQAEAVVEQLEDRGLPVPDDVRARILDCIDPVILELWLKTVNDVRAAEDLLVGQRLFLELEEAERLKKKRLEAEFLAEEAELAGGAEGEPDLGEGAA